MQKVIKNNKKDWPITLTFCSENDEVNLIDLETEEVKKKPKVNRTTCNTEYTRTYQRLPLQKRKIFT